MCFWWSVRCKPGVLSVSVNSNMWTKMCFSVITSQLWRWQTLHCSRLYLSASSRLCLFSWVTKSFPSEKKRLFEVVYLVFSQKGGSSLYQYLPSYSGSGLHTHAIYMSSYLSAVLNLDLLAQGGRRLKECIWGRAYHLCFILPGALCTQHKCSFPAWPVLLL